MKQQDATTYPACRRYCGDRWEEIALLVEDGERLPALADGLGLPFLPDLARLERAVATVEDAFLPERVDEVSVNPTLLLVNFSWRNLPAARSGTGEPEQGEDRLLLWREKGGEVRVERATNERLLALKVVLEGLDFSEVAREGGVATASVDDILRMAAAEGLVLNPPSRIRRLTPVFDPVRWPEEYLAAETFSLQWHVTNRCDLSCRHCYDPTDRHPFPAERGFELLRELKDFCRSRNVRGHVSFTGGNPFLHRDFDAFYEEAARLGLSASILGNPVPRGRLEEIVAIARPTFFQVSLEGLREHNDAIRGTGNFDAVLSFLDLLAASGVYSVVMLTLTRANLHEVLPLADLLRDRASVFAFNRLATYGRGEALAMVRPEEYRVFLRHYLDEANSNPVLGRKDSLLNVVHRERGDKLFGGCTGFGCGAAFNFVSVLADGEVHACRKFPSHIGNIMDSSLERIYDSPRAARYRGGSAGCAGCDLRAVCGGCLAVTAATGLDPLIHRDPYCFHPGGATINSLLP